MDWATLASIATAFGVAIAAWQIWESRKIYQAQFEDSFDKQYRDLTRDIPVDALIGGSVPQKEKARVRELIYNYLDLSNEQAYLRRTRRVRRSRWIEWNEGIRNNLKKPAFRVVWEEIKEKAPDEFTELARLEKDNFEGDPARRHR